MVRAQGQRLAGLAACALVLAGCIVADERPEQMADATLCFFGDYSRGTDRHEAYRRELARRDMRCTPQLIAAERQRLVDKANEQPPPHFYGGPP